MAETKPIFSPCDDTSCEEEYCYNMSLYKKDLNGERVLGLSFFISY